MPVKPQPSDSMNPADAVFARSSVEQARMVELPRVVHPNGSLTFEQNGPGSQLPFEVKRVYYLYDIPGDSSRGGHAHRSNASMIVAASGSFDVTLSDGVRSRTFTLNRPYRGLLVPPGLWREVDNFASGSVCLVLTSELFSEEDYVRDHDRFLQLTSGKNHNL